MNGSIMIVTTDTIPGNVRTLKCLGLVEGLSEEYPIIGMAKSNAMDKLKEAALAMKADAVVGLNLTTTELYNRVSAIYSGTAVQYEESGLILG